MVFKVKLFFVYQTREKGWMESSIILYLHILHVIYGFSYLIPKRRSWYNFERIYKNKPYLSIILIKPILAKH